MTFISPVPEIDATIETQMDILGRLEDLDEMEYSESKIQEVLRAYTNKERATIKKLREQMKERNRQFEKAKKHLKAAGVVLVEEEEN